MRFVIAILVALWAALPAHAFYATAGYDIIGQFDTRVAQSPVTFYSVISKDGTVSDVRTRKNNDGISYLIDGYGSTLDGIPDFPFIKLLIQPNAQGGYDLARFVMIENEEGYHAPFIARKNAHGRLELSGFMITDSGDVSFSFDVDLIRIRLSEAGDEILPTGEHVIGRRIKGTYTGVFPAGRLIK